MAKTITIKKRVNLTVFSLAVVSITLMGLFAYKNQKQQLHEGLRDLAKNENRLFDTILAADAEGLARAQSGLTRLAPLLGPFTAGKKGELLAAAQPIFNDIRQNNNITHMYFIQPDGAVMLRVHKPEQAGDKLARATFRKAAETKKIASGLEMGKNFFSLRCVQPVSFQGKPAGFMEVAEEIDHIFSQMKAITGNDVSIFLTEEFLKSHPTDLQSEQVGSFRIIYPTNKAVTLQLAARQLPAMKGALREPAVNIVALRGAKYVVGMSPVKDAAGNTVGILFSQKDVTPLFSAMWKGIATNIAILIAIMVASLVFLYFSLRKSLALFEALRQHIVTVTTTWDLTRRLKVDTADEIGGLAGDFNLMTEKLAVMVTQVDRSGRELGRVSGNIHQVSGKVTSAAERQAHAVNETSSAITQINASIKGVAQGVDGLSNSAAESSSSILEMAASVEEVALNAESLAQSVEEVSSSISQMAASIRQVGVNAGNLMEAANITSSSVMEMDSSIKEVEKNALGTAAISEEVRRDAEMGKQAVEATIDGINAIKSSSRITSEVIDTLSERARDIGAILSVIDDVAGQTNLLALNAAIIAAQAGEHGKGFAVVAEEIKGLAERTSSSTREIGEVIKGVQDETRRAVEAISQAEQSIAQGETLSRKSGEALNKIVAGVQMATDQVNSIARATMEQAKGSEMIRDAMEQVSGMVGQIAAATREQGQGSELIIAAVERMKKVTAQVKSSTREQSNVGNFIARSTENITDMICQIKRACDEQSRGSEQIIPAVENITSATDSNLEAVRILGDTMESLAAQIGILHDEIGRFTIGAAEHPEGR
ncbi:MAG: methyl-accepting chemotaxis protein [Geobacteraceae bacterium]|nr:methyl-accepting chemotaxis protein [Geobacteraceae bacterium]